jgi:isoleucyl-tRNA synthetase
LAPFAPFISEYNFRALTGRESVHLERFPEREGAENGVVAPMRKVQSIVAAGKQLREQHKLRNRLPLAKIQIAGWRNEDFADILLDELNVKNIEYIGDVADAADSFVFPITPKIAERLGGAALKDILPAIKSGKYGRAGGKLTAGGHELNEDEYEIRLTVKPGITGAALPDNTAVVVLNTDLTPELIAEGLANDALRFIQDTRRAIGLDVSDRIKLSAAGDAEILRSLKTWEQRVMSETLAVEVAYSDAPLEHKTEIEGLAFSIGIAKAS